MQAPTPFCRQRGKWKKKEKIGERRDRNEKLKKRGKKERQRREKRTVSSIITLT